MTAVIRRIRSVLIAVVVLALSAGLAFGAQPPDAASWGVSNTVANGGKAAAVADDQGDGTDDDIDDATEDADEDLEEIDETEDVDDGTDVNAEGAVEEASEACSTDPTTVTDEEIAALSHGSLVCWAAHQTTWPEEFKNHGQWVSSWAHWGKDAETPKPAKTKAKTR